MLSAIAMSVVKKGNIMIMSEIPLIGVAYGYVEVAQSTVAHARCRMT
jgi:hypothetical protein